MKTHPKLLVSVRNAAEARAAIAGGCDILDVKEPHAGSLGRTSTGTWQEIVAVLESFEGDQSPLSLALGELSEIHSTGPIPRDIPKRAKFLKVGLSGIGHDWRNLLSQFQRQVEEANESRFQWVSVAYVDFERAESPRTWDVIDHAIETESPVLLLDTFQKDAKTLFDFVNAEQLQQIAVTCAANDIQIAVAGRIAAEDLPKLKEIGVDIVAVRSAVCESGERTGTVTTQAVQSFHQVMEHCFQTGQRSELIEAEALPAD